VVEAYAVCERKEVEQLVVCLELTPNLVLLVCILPVLELVVRVGGVVGGEVVTRRVERVAQVFLCGYAYVAGNVVERVDRRELLSAGNCAVFRVGVVDRGAEGELLVGFVAAACRESVLVVRVGAGGIDTVVVNVGERNEVVALVGCAVERHAVVERNARVEEVAYVVLYGTVALNALGVVVNVSVHPFHAVEAGTPRAVLNGYVFSVCALAEHVLHFNQACNLCELDTTVVGNAEAFFVLRTFLGGNHDNAVGSAATVECRCGSALEHCHLGYVVGVDGCCTVTEVVVVVELVLVNTVARRGGGVVDGHTVDDVQRLVVAAQRAETADYDRSR